MAAERQLGVDALLDRGQPQFLETLALRADRWLEREIREWAPPPEGLARPKGRDGPFGVAVVAGASTVRKELLERMQIGLARLDPDQIPGRARDQPFLCVAVDGKRFAQPRDVHVERMVGAPGRRVGKQPVQQAVAGDDPVGVQQEQREQRPLLRAANRNRSAVHPHFERPEDRELHRSSLAQRAPCFKRGCDPLERKL